MTSATEDVVRAYYAAVDRGDVDAILGIFAADAVYDRPGYPTICGRDALRHFYVEERVLSGGSHVLIAVISDADRVSCFGTYVGKKRSGEPVNVLFADFHRVESEHITERRTFFFVPFV